MSRSSDLRSMAFLLGHFSLPHWPVLAGLLAASTGAAALATIHPLVLAPALDVAVATRTAPARSLGELDLNNLGPTILSLLDPSLVRADLIILVVAVVYVGIGGALAALNFTAGRLSVELRILTIMRMQRGLYDHALRLPMSFHVSRRTGVLLGRMTDDVTTLANTFEPIVRGLLMSGIQIAFFGAVLFRTEPVLASATLGASLLHLGTTRALQRRMRDRTVELSDAMADARATMQEGLVSIRVVKSFAAESAEAAKLEGRLVRFAARWGRLGTIQALEEPLRRSTDSLALGIVLIVAFAALSGGTLTVPGFALFFYMARSTITPIAAFSAALVSIQGFLGASTRLMEIFAVRPDPVSADPSTQRFTAEVRLDDVSFTYGRGSETIAHVDLAIRKGERVALVGASGAGKSTLVDLILRLYEPTSGQILLDGQDVGELPLGPYRRLFGVVPQEALLFNGTIAENIAYGRSIDEVEIVRAARTANAEEFILDLPDGYATTVGDRGIRLSGGQRQRVAIARAVYGHPAILVLDEATSALDPASEAAVQRGIDRALEGVTALVIAHRSITIRSADRVVLMEGGRIGAVGLHAELLAASGSYRELYGAQPVVGDGTPA